MIILLKGYPYDNSYNYIKLFSNKTAQDNYFDGLEQIVVDENNYVRDNNQIKIGFNYDYLVNEGVNYLIFNNGHKDIYAFITKKEYISKDVTMLHYEVDVLNTYLFDFTLKESYVERKVCDINEVSDFDEGLNFGEHIIESDTVMLNKNCEYFALFNGIKEQVPIYEDNVLKSVVDLPYSTSKPTTKIDGILYPLYFMPLSQTYSPPTREELYPPSDGVGGGGSGILSAKIYRYLKGWEGFSPVPYDDGAGTLTIGYGTTKASGYWNELYPSCTEKQASEILAKSIEENYAVSLLDRMKNDGVDITKMKQQHFDAFLSLCYNGGLGAVTDSPMYNKFIKDMSEPTITNGWENWYTTSNGIFMQGLQDRRIEEKNIFDEGIYKYRTIAYADYSDTVKDNNGHGHIPSSVKGSV